MEKVLFFSGMAVALFSISGVNDRGGSTGLDMVSSHQMEIDQSLSLSANGHLQTGSVDTQDDPEQEWMIQTIVVPLAAAMGSIFQAVCSPVHRVRATNVICFAPKQGPPIVS